MRHPYAPIQPIKLAVDSDGKPCRLTLRPIRPDDAPRLAALFGRMSPAARRQRFHCATRGPSAAALQAMSCVDFEHDSAWVVSQWEGEDEALMGEARWHLNEHNPGGDSAEFAIAVADSLHHQGVGRRLMRVLEEDALAHGVRCLYGDVLSGNAAMLALMQRCGYVVDGDGGVDCYAERACGETVRVEHRLAGPAPARLDGAGWRQALVGICRRLNLA